ncbi:hypothetical protein [Streptomyces puniciscabiei]|uniref:hypothetical protein n=1 Tax=Streptomyces puniciscabiei TaxID=164348 RepID=UPI00131ABD24|nr:hypothetical protein [Streptomyces puniciscabiei]
MGGPLSESTPSQAEGEREPGSAEAEQPSRTTPSQAEGEDTADENAEEGDE